MKETALLGDVELPGCGRTGS